MLETSARLLRLLALLQIRRFWTGAELAERLEITERTVRRDVEKLRTLGYPVDGSAGVAGGYQLGVGASMPPLILEDDEALALSLGLRTAASSAVTGIEEAALRALVKVERLLPERLRRRADSLRDAITRLSAGGPHVDAELLTSLARACAEHLLVQFDYQKGNEAAAGPDSKKERRVVEPVGLVQNGSRWYLVAWDAKREDWRTFRVDRFQGPATLGARFLARSPPDDGDLRKYVSRSISLSSYEHQARVLFSASRHELAQRIPPAFGVLEEVDAGTCRLLTGGRTIDSLAYWVATMGFDFVIEGPPELEAALRDLHSRLDRSLGPRGRTRVAASAHARDSVHGRGPARGGAK